VQVFQHQHQGDLRGYRLQDRGPLLENAALVKGLTLTWG
jgi:hypothetical protein